MRANDRNRAWIVVVLLFTFMVINFADKAVVGIAAVPIMRELELGPRQFGLVGSSFFLLFAVSSVATEGVERYEPHVQYLLMARFALSLETAMRMVCLAVVGAIWLATMASNPADAARICKDGYFYYSGSEFHHNKDHAEASAVRAWRAIQAHAHGAGAAANMFPSSRQVHCTHSVNHDGWRCFVRGSACHVT